MVRVALFATLTAVGAYIVLPLPFIPVPFTLQLFFAILSPLVLGARYGALSQIVYLALGVVGIPVFAGGTSGLGVLLGPTGGFLVGFVVGAYVVGKLHNALDGRVGSIAQGVVAGMGGLIAIHGLGAFWLASATEIEFGRALALGCLPYIVPDSIKCAAAIMVADALRRRFPRISPIPLG